jgi:hypothetical protein
MNKITKGYYKHFKHNPLPRDFNYHYEVLGTSRHTETGETLVIYRPLYSNEYLNGADSFSRPITKFKERVIVAQIEINRFELITDTETIERLDRVREEMYGK